MKEIFVLLFTFSILTCFSQDSSKVYNLQFKSIDGTKINMLDFKGRQTLVVEFSASNPDRKQLVSLDSLYRSRKASLQIIGIPVNNSDTANDKANIIKLSQVSVFITC